jgi:hypothetical protein
VPFEVNVKVQSCAAPIVQVQVVGVAVAGVVEKTTLPPGTAVPAVKGGVTVAVTVTGAFTAEGLGEDATLVTGVALLTTSGTMFEAPLLKFEFELVNVAVIEWVAAEESGTVQGGTIPPVKVTGTATVPNVQSTVAPSV